MKHVIHAFAGTTAIILIFTFWTSSLISEIVMDNNSVALVKKWIVYGLFILVPCLAITGGSGIAQLMLLGLNFKDGMRMRHARLMRHLA